MVQSPSLSFTKNSYTTTCKTATYPAPAAYVQSCIVSMWAMLSNVRTKWAYRIELNLWVKQAPSSFGLIPPGNHVSRSAVVDNMRVIIIRRPVICAPSSTDGARGSHTVFDRFCGDAAAYRRLCAWLATYNMILTVCISLAQLCRSLPLPCDHPNYARLIKYALYSIYRGELCEN